MNAERARAAIHMAHRKYGATHNGMTGPFEYLVLTYRQWADVRTTAKPTDLPYLVPPSSVTPRWLFHGLKVLPMEKGAPAPVNHALCVDLRGLA